MNNSILNLYLLSFIFLLSSLPVLITLLLRHHKHLEICLSLEPATHPWPPFLYSSNPVARSIFLPHSFHFLSLTLLLLMCLNFQGNKVGMSPQAPQHTSGQSMLKGGSVEPQLFSFKLLSLLRDGSELLLSSFVWLLQNRTQINLPRWKIYFGSQTWRFQLMVT